MNEYSDEYETYGYQQLSKEYFEDHPEIYDPDFDSDEFTDLVEEQMNYPKYADWWLRMKFKPGDKVIILRDNFTPYWNGKKGVVERVQSPFCYSEFYLAITIKSPRGRIDRISFVENEMKIRKCR
jgi:hypothetical protein